MNAMVSPTMMVEAKQTSDSLKIALDELCMRDAKTEGAEFEDFLIVTGHTASIINALVSVSEDAKDVAVEDFNALLREGNLLFKSIRAELEGGTL